MEKSTARRSRKGSSSCSCSDERVKLRAELLTCPNRYQNQTQAWFRAAKLIERSNPDGRERIEDEHEHEHEDES